MPQFYHHSDLHWPLSTFEQPLRANELLDRLSGALPVYSASVRKLYTEYTTSIVNSNEPLLVIEPDMQQFGSMFHHIGLEAIARTSVIIFADQQALKLSGVMANQGFRQTFSLQEGLYRLFCGEFVDGAFLPVITYGDLRTLPNSTKPILQLHGLKVEAMTALGEFQVNDIVTTLKANLISRLSETNSEQ